LAHARKRAQGARRPAGQANRHAIRAGHPRARWIDGGSWPGTVADRIEPPGARDTLERPLAAVVEVEPGADDEVDDGLGDQHLAGLGQRGDARDDVHRQAAEILASHLALAGVHPGAHPQPQLGGLVHDGSRGANRPCRPGEDREGAVAERLDHAPVGGGDSGLDELVMPFEQFAPRGVAELRRAAGGIRDVGEHDGREDALGIGRPAAAGQELLDLPDDRVGVLRPHRVVCARELHQARALDPVRDEAAVRHRDDVGRALQDECETAPSAAVTSTRRSASISPRAIAGETAARSKVPNARRTDGLAMLGAIKSAQRPLAPMIERVLEASTRRAISPGRPPKAASSSSRGRPTAIEP
jgi:hypothetical protein